MRLSELAIYVLALLVKNGDKDVYVTKSTYRPELETRDIYLRDIRKCKYIDCVNYSEDAEDYCCNACASDDHDYQRLKKEKIIEAKETAAGPWESNGLKA